MEEIDLKELVRQNQEMLTSVDKRLHKIEKHFRLEMIMNWLKWLIIVVPIVFGIIYISPYVRTYASMLQPALQALKLDNINQLLGNTVNSGKPAPAGTGLEALCDPVKRQVIINQYCK
jgi:hypothetical protein